MDFDAAERVAVDAARAAGAVLLEHLDKVKTVSFKAKSDIVTEVDLEAEKIILGRLQAVFPHTSVLSEEEGFRDEHSDHLWIVDPIDGTMNYYHASSPFRVGICLLENKEPVLSVIYNPVRDQLFLARKGMGATINGERISVNENPDLKNSIVMTHLSSRKEARARTILVLEQVFSKTLHMRLLGSGLAAMTYIAKGQFDVFFNVRTHPWDILPGALLVEEAGGTVTDIEGKKLTYESTSILATNGKVHAQMLKLLEGI